MPWTSLPALLGAAGGELTFELIEQACAHGLPERADLDWKGQLPLTVGADAARAAAQQEELAKDIAAMANSGGGLIIYGVAESRRPGQSNADRVHPVGEVDEETMQGVRRCAANLIYPPVTGLQLFELYPDGDPAGGVLALLVPDSPDAPHLVHPKKQNQREWFGVPWRNGSHTAWMLERQIAAAYRQREQSRRTRERDLAELYDTTVEGCLGLSDAAWVIAVARPDQLGRRPRDLTQQRARAVFNDAWVARESFGFVGDGMGPMDWSSDAVPVTRGLQMFRREVATVPDQSKASAPGLVASSLHVYGDGSVAAGFTRAGWGFPLGPSSVEEVAVVDLERTGIHLWFLLEQARLAIGITGDYALRIGVTPAAPTFRFPDRLSALSFEPFAGQRTVPGYRPVTGPVLTSMSREEAAHSLVDLVRDAVHQAGSESDLTAEQLTRGD